MDSEAHKIHYFKNFCCCFTKQAQRRCEFEAEAKRKVSNLVN